ncbi:MAG: hypothetical protein INF44_06310 [Thalassospira sp.]|nr:hypothetical protein [Thalassospira sp.]
MNNRKLLASAAFALISATVIPSCGASQEGTKNKPDTQPSTPAATVVSAPASASTPTTAPTATSKPDANPVASAPVATSKERICFNVTSYPTVNPNPTIGSKITFIGTLRDKVAKANFATLNFWTIKPALLDPNSRFGSRNPLAADPVITDKNGKAARVKLKPDNTFEYVGDDGNQVQGFVPPSTTDPLNAANALYLCSDNPLLPRAVEELKCPTGTTILALSLSAIKASDALTSEAQKESQTQALWVITGLTREGECR